MADHFARARRDAPPPPTFPKSGRRLLHGAALLLVIAGFLGALIVLGRWGREQLRGRDRYLVPLAEIECVPPPGLERQEFLDEVQYLAELPARLPLLDEALPARLEAAFARHPWVERVEAVTITPPRRIAVRLTYRRPVLAVPHGGVLRAVDGAGVLLPRGAPTDGLPRYDGTPAPPRGGAGSAWGDAEVERRARALASQDTR